MNKKLDTTLLIMGWLALFLLFFLDEKSFDGDFSRTITYIGSILIFWASTNIWFAYRNDKNGYIKFSKGYYEDDEQELIIEDFSDVELVHNHSVDFEELANRYADDRPISLDELCEIYAEKNKSTK